MWLLIYYLSTTTEDRGSLTVEESLDMEDHFMRGGSIKEQERSNLLGNMNQKVCLRNNYTRSVLNLPCVIQTIIYFQILIRRQGAIERLETLEERTEKKMKILGWWIQITIILAMQWR